MKTLTQILSHSNSRLIIWVFIFLFPFIFIWQDGDLTDTGYNLSVYHFFFERLNLGVTDSLIFLTEWIGGLWLKAFPSLGILGIKLLAVSVYFINIYLSWRILKDLFPKNKFIPFFILPAVIFCLRAFPIVFNYDLLTSFFLILFIFLIRKGEKSLTTSNIAVLGLISAAMMLARFPNIFILVVFPAFLLIAHLLKLIHLPIRKYFQILCLYMLSFGIGTLFFFLVLKNLGWYKIFLNNFLNLTNLFADNNESYDIFFVLNRYFLDTIYFLLYFIATCILFFSFKFASQKWNKTILFSSLFFLFLCILSFYPFVFNYNNSVKYITPALIIIPFIAYKASKKTAFIGLLLLFLMLIQIAGSNTGIFLKISLLFVLAFPLSMLHLTSNLPKNLNLFGFIPSLYTLMLSTLVHLVFIYGLGGNSNIRLEATYPINLPQYKGLKTTQAQAVKIETIVRDIQLHKDQNQNLFIYGHQPMLYYLSDAAPAVKEFWLVGNNLISFPDLFDQMSDLKQKPLFLDTKENIFSETDEQSKREFLSRNRFKLVISNQFYDIWKAKE